MYGSDWNDTAAFADMDARDAADTARDERDMQEWQNYTESRSSTGGALATTGERMCSTAGAYDGAAEEQSRVTPHDTVLNTIRNWGSVAARKAREARDAAGLSHMAPTLPVAAEESAIEEAQRRPRGFEPAPELTPVAAPARKRVA